MAGDCAALARCGVRMRPAGEPNQTPEVEAEALGTRRKGWKGSCSSTAASPHGRPINRLALKIT